MRYTTAIAQASPAQATALDPLSSYTVLLAAIGAIAISLVTGVFLILVQRTVTSSSDRIDRLEAKSNQNSDQIHVVREMQLQDRIEAREKYVTYEDWLVATNKIDARSENMAVKIQEIYVLMEALKGRL